MRDPIVAMAAARQRRRKYYVIGLVIVLIVYLVACYVVAPDRMPSLAQRGLAAGFVGLALGLYWLVTGEAEIPEELAYRVRRGQSVDFGRLARSQRPRRKALRIPRVGEISWRAIGAAVLVLVLGGWWLSPFAPVIVRPAELEDLTVPLGEEILAAELVMPGEGLAVLQWPMIPPKAKQLARYVRDQDGFGQRALRALAEERFDDARAMLAEAARDGVTPARLVAMVRGQTELFDGRFSEAVAWYAKAIEAAPDDAPLRAQAAVAWLHAGGVAQAEALVSEAAEKVKTLGEDDPARAVVLHVQAVVALAAGRDLEAAPGWCARSRTVFEKVHGRQHPLVAASLNNQAVLYAIQGKYDGAVPLFDGARDVYRAALGPDDPHVAGVQGNLMVIDVLSASLEQAERRLAQVLETVGPRLRDDHPARAVWLAAGALGPLERNDLETAQRRAGQGLTLAEKAAAAELPCVAAAAQTLARIAAARAQYAKASQYTLRAAAAIRKYWHEKHPFMAEVLIDQARILICQGRLDEAEAACEQGLALGREGFGPSHPWVASGLLARARIEMARDRARSARPLVEEALRIRRGVFGKSHPDVAEALAALASLDNSPRSYPEGVARFQEAIDMTRRALGDGDPRVARLWFGLGELHLQRANVAEADACLAKAQAIQEQALVEYHPELAATLEARASALPRLEPPQTQRAEQLRARAKTIRQNHAAQDRAN